MEYLTNELIRKGWAHLQEVEKLGGMAKAIETGLPKMRIEEAAARRQAAIDSGKEPIIGVNKYRLEQEAQIDILEVDNTTVREAQIARLQKLRARNGTPPRAKPRWKPCPNAPARGKAISLTLPSRRPRPAPPPG